MNKEQIEKQAIEEMAKVIETTEQIARDAHCGLPSPRMYAKDLYWKGYRKQREGEWEQRTDVVGFVRCSVCKDCNVYDEWVDGKRWNYCPNCGAKMKGV